MGQFRTGSSTFHVSMHSTMEISTLGHVNSCIKACGWAWLCRNWRNCTCGIHLHIYMSVCSLQNTCPSAQIMVKHIHACAWRHIYACVYICFPCLDLHPHMQTWFHMHTHLDIHMKSQISSCMCISVHVSIQAIWFSACSWMKMHINLYAYAALHLPRHHSTMYCVCAHRYVHFILLRDKQEQGYWGNLALVSYEVIRTQF